MHSKNERSRYAAEYQILCYGHRLGMEEQGRSRGKGSEEGKLQTLRTLSILF